jgi:hypothetical protein
VQLTANEDSEGNLREPGINPNKIMKTFLFLILTAFVATGAMLAGLNQHGLLTGYGIAIGLWVVFILRCKKKVNKR